MKRVLSLLGAVLIPALVLAQPPAGGQNPAPATSPAPRLSVTSSAWPDGGEIPMHYSGRGDNKSPAFDFHWATGTTPSAAPAGLQSYAVIFHDVENSTMRGTADTLHWSAFNIPGTATGLLEGLAPGETLPDGTTHGPGISRRNGNPGGYFGPGAGPGPFHHYVFEFYALDIKLTLPGTTTREELLKAMDGHVIGKAAFFGRFPSPTPR